MKWLGKQATFVFVHPKSPKNEPIHYAERCNANYQLHDCVNFEMVNDKAGYYTH